MDEGGRIARCWKGGRKIASHPDLGPQSITTDTES